MRGKEKKKKTLGSARKREKELRKAREKERKSFERRAREREKDLRKCEAISCQSGADVALTRKSHRWVVLTYVPLVALTEASQMCHYHEKLCISIRRA